jgi:hypothetical protein
MPLRLWLGFCALTLVLGVGLAVVFHHFRGPEGGPLPDCSQGTLGFAGTFALVRNGKVALVGYSAAGPSGRAIVTCRLTAAAREGSSVRVTDAGGTELFSSADPRGAPPGAVVTQPARFSVEVTAERFCAAPQPLTVTAKGLGVEVTGTVRLSNASGTCQLV